MIRAVDLETLDDVGEGVSRPRSWKRAARYNSSGSGVRPSLSAWIRPNRYTRLEWW